MTKSDLRSLIREVLQEELHAHRYITEGVNLDRILADKLLSNPEFETACLSGDANKIMAIVDEEMEKNNLFTPGAKKVRFEIMRMIQGRTRLSSRVGQEIYAFAWYAKGQSMGIPKAI